MTVEQAKEQLRIPSLWERLGIGGEPKKSCRSPFRDDSSPSFSVYDGGRRWKDFSTSEGGDAIDFLAQASGLSPKEATKKFLEMAGGGRDSPVARMVPRPRPKPTVNRPPLSLPELRDGTEKEYWELEKLRKISAGPLRKAHKRGLLFFAEVKGLPAWVVTDKARRNAQARRLDGEPWKHIGGKKAYTLPGSAAAYPIGAEESKPFPFVALVEGAPDLLACIQYCWAESRLEDVAPVAMLGAGNSIPEESLPLFAGKRVRIFPHLDASGAGQRAARKWASQLASVGAEVDGFSFEGLKMTNGEPVRDFNDMTQIDGDSYDSLEEDVMP